jgi:DNA-binding MarR family transcriptional regulator
MSDAHETSPSLETVVEELLQATGQLLRRLRAESNPAELTLSQRAAMAHLGREGWMTTADLARVERVKPQSMGATLAALEREGMVQRRPHSTDGRQVLFGLTELGVETRQRNRLLKVQWLKATLEKLDPPERQALIAAIALIKHLGES